MVLALIFLGIGFLAGVLATAYLCMVGEFERRGGEIDLTGMRRASE